MSLGNSNPHEKDLVTSYGLCRCVIIEVRVAQIPTPFCAQHKVTQAMWAWQNAPDAESKEKVHAGLVLLS